MPTFEHNDAIFTTIASNSVMEAMRPYITREIANVVAPERGFPIKGDDDYMSVPNSLFALFNRFAEMMQVTHIEGESVFADCDIYAFTAKDKTAYYEWEKLFLRGADPALVAKWDNAIKEANREVLDPLAKSNTTVQPNATNETVTTDA